MISRTTGNARALWGIAFVLWSLPVAALVPEGPEFQINVTSTFSQITPDVAGVPGGGFLVTWVHVRNDGGDFRDLFVRRYDATGTPLSGEISASVFDNRPTSGLPIIESDAAGDFVIAFSVQNLIAGFYTDIFYRRFNADGTPKESTRIATHRFVEDNFLGDLAVAADGSFVETWAGCCESSPPWGVFSRFVDAAGATAADFSHQDEAIVSSGIAAVPGGGFVLAVSGVDVRALQLDSIGVATGPPIPINTTSGGQFQPKAEAQPDGTVVITWASGSFGTPTLRGQRLGTDGTLVGPELALTDGPLPEPASYDLAILPNGDFVVTWAQTMAGTSGRSIYARLFDAAGTPLTGDVLVNASDFGNEERPRIAATATDEVVIVWQNTDGQDGSEAGVFGQRMRIAVPIFTDGFESGDLSAWSGALP